MEPSSLRIPGSHGIEIHGLEWSTDGVPMLLLHGFGNEAHIWDDFAPAVAPHYAVLATEHRGHGDSDWAPDGRYDHESMLADVEAVLDARGVDRFVLIGHSLGGRISTLFGPLFPIRKRSPDPLNM